MKQFVLEHYLLVYNMNQLFLALSGVSSEVWCGLIRKSVDDAWGWIRNGRHPGPDKQGDWGPDDPNGPTDLCARLINGKDFLAGDRVCSEKLRYVCEIWN